MDDFRIAFFQDSIHRPEFKIVENRMFREMDLFQSSGKGKETPNLLGPLESVYFNHWSTNVTSTTI
jgi:hypothetical protein